MVGFGNQYNPCSPPICEDDIIVRILSYPSCIEYGDNITISWTIDNNTETPLSNNLLWSFNNSTFSNIVINENNEKPYYTFFNASLSQGLIYFKVKVNINGTFYESDTYIININKDCGSNINIIPVKNCECINNTNQLNNLWIEEKGFPLIIDETIGIKTIFFKYDTNCYYIDNNGYINRQVDNNDTNKIVINFDTSISLFNYFDCDDCCLTNTCDMEVFNSEVNINNGRSYFLNTGSTICITLQYKAYYLNQPIKIVISNSDTAEILYDSSYTNNTDWVEVDITTNGVGEISIIVVTQSDEVATWTFKIKCCE